MKDYRYKNKKDLEWIEELTYKQKLQLNEGMNGICIYHDSSDCNFYGYGVWCYGKCKVFEIEKR